MHEASHPVWQIIRLSVLMAALCVILKLNATNFDATELRVIIFSFMTAAGLEFIPGLAKKFMKE